MSIVNRYWLRCNKCTRNMYHLGSKEYNSIEKAEEKAKEKGWLKLGKEHYCPKCQVKIDE